MWWAPGRWETMLVFKCGQFLRKYTLLSFDLHMHVDTCVHVCTLWIYVVIHTLQSMPKKALWFMNSICPVSYYYHNNLIVRTALSLEVGLSLHCRSFYMCYKTMFQIDLCVCMCTSMNLCAPHISRCPQRPEGTGLSGNGVEAVVSRLLWVLGTEPRASSKKSKHSSMVSSLSSSNLYL